MIYRTKLADKLNEIYNALFVHRYTSNDCEKRVGTLSFSINTKEQLMRAVSMLSDYADYEI